MSCFCVSGCIKFLFFLRAILRLSSAVTGRPSRCACVGSDARLHQRGPAHLAALLPWKGIDFLAAGNFLANSDPNQSFDEALTQASFNTMRYKGRDSVLGIGKKFSTILPGAATVVAP